MSQNPNEDELMDTSVETSVDNTADDQVETNSSDEEDEVSE